MLGLHSCGRTIRELHAREEQGEESLETETALQVHCSERPGKQKCGKGVWELGEAVFYFVATGSRSSICSCNIFLVIHLKLDRSLTRTQWGNLTQSSEIPSKPFLIVSLHIKHACCRMDVFT